MDHRDLTADHARVIAGPIVPALVYLGRLHDRMRRRRVPADDPLTVKVTFALEAMRQLREALHEVESQRPPTAMAGAAQIIPELNVVPQWQRATGVNTFDGLTLCQ